MGHMSELSFTPPPAELGPSPMMVGDGELSKMAGFFLGGSLGGLTDPSYCINLALMPQC